MGTDLTPDEQRLQGFLSDPDVPDDAKRQAVAHYRAIGSGGSEPAGSGDGSGSQADSPGLGAALWESLSRGRERVEGAVRDIGERITNPSDYADESLWDTTKGVAGDVATMAAPALMPGATAAGVGARTLARAAGATPETADAAGDITTGVTALGGALKGGYQGVQAWRAGRTAAALRAAQEAAAAPTAAREAGQVSQAAAAASTREALSGSSTPETAGATLREQYPGASAAGRERVQGELYDPVAQYAASKGLALEPGTPQAQALSAALEGARDKWGALQTGRERGVIESLLEKLKGGTEATDTGVLDAAGTPITRTAPPAPVTYADLDAASLALTKVRGVSSARAAIRDAMLKVVEGTPAEAKLRYAGDVWKGAVAPAESLARKVAVAESPMKAFQAVMQGTKATDPQRLRIARNLLDDASWSRVAGGFYDGLFRQAGGDGVKATRLWARVPAESQQLLDPSGRGAQLFQGLADLARLEKSRLGAVKASGVVAAKGVSPLAVARHGAAGVETAQAGWAALHGRWRAALIHLAAAGGVELAGPAATMLAKFGGGAIKSPAAARLGAALVSWSADQPPETQDAAQAIAGALNGGEVPPVPPRPAAGAAAPSSDQAAPTAYAPSSGFTREMGAVARVVGVDPRLLRAVVAQESAGDPNAVSEAGAVGLTQLMPVAVRQYGSEAAQLLGRPADPRNPLDKLVMGALY